MSVVPFKIIPPPTAVALVGLVELPNSILTSSTCIVEVWILELLPVTVKLPDIFKSPPTWTFSFTPNPPLNTKQPVVFVVELVSVFILTIPFWSIVIAFVFVVVPIFILSFTIRVYIV